jgi:hypothetical protein
MAIILILYNCSRTCAHRAVEAKYEGGKALILSEILLETLFPRKNASECREQDRTQRGDPSDEQDLRNPKQKLKTETPEVVMPISQPQLTTLPHTQQTPGNYSLFIHTHIQSFNEVEGIISTWKYARNYSLTVLLNRFK